MRKGSRIGAFAVLAVAALVAVTAPAPCGAEVKGQRPMMIVEDVFQFTPGAWSDYLIHDRSKQEYYRMSIATLERLDRNGKPCSWMEIGVTPEKEPPVVTRLLVEQTKTGPGRSTRSSFRSGATRPSLSPRASSGARTRTWATSRVRPSRNGSRGG